VSKDIIEASGTERENATIGKNIVHFVVLHSLPPVLLCTMLYKSAAQVKKKEKLRQCFYEIL
jgi:hypothetical protein